jgi:hypothetical protein
MLKGFLLGALLGALVTAGFALPLGAAGSELGADLKAVSKLGVSLSDIQNPAGLKVKRFCACRNAAENTADQKVGIMVYRATGHVGFDRVGIECHVPRYNQNDGTRFDTDFCAEWVPLPK